MAQLPDRLVRMCQAKRRAKINQLEDYLALILIELEADPLCTLETDDEDVARAAQDYGLHVVCEHYLGENQGKWSMSLPDLSVYDGD